MAGEYDGPEIRRARCPACGRTIEFMVGAPRPECPYCGGQVRGVKPDSLAALEQRLQVTAGDA